MTGPSNYSVAAISFERHPAFTPKSTSPASISFNSATSARGFSCRMPDVAGQAEVRPDWSQVARRISSRLPVSVSSCTCGVSSGPARPMKTRPAGLPSCGSGPATPVVLTPQEADQLFVTLKRLANEGCAILYISHRLEEVKRLCHTATILRLGKVVATVDPAEETAASWASNAISPG